MKSICVTKHLKSNVLFPYCNCLRAILINLTSKLDNDSRMFQILLAYLSGLKTQILLWLLILVSQKIG